MASKQIYWGDGTDDVFTLTFTGTAGESSMSVLSAPNLKAAARSKTVALKDGGGVQLASLTVVQEGDDAIFLDGYLRPGTYLRTHAKLSIVQ